MKKISLFLAFVIFLNLFVAVQLGVSAQASEDWSFVNAYEDFESYADADDTSYGQYDYINLKELSSVNGGTGWDGGWYDNNSDTISGEHKLSLKQDNNGNVWREFDLYTSEWRSYPLKRNFATPIDFREAGEYYIKINAQPAHTIVSQWLAGYDMKISVGDKISFGVKYVEGKTVAGTSPYMYPYLTTGETTIENTENGVVTASYHEHFVQIIADGHGNATVTYTAGGKIVLKGSVSGLTTADYICLSGGGSTRLCDIAIEGYSKETLDSIRAMFSDVTKTSEVLSAMDDLGDITKDVLYSEFNAVASKKYISEDFESYADASDTSYGRFDYINLTDLSSVNGGIGWDGGWYDNDSGTISGSHKLSLKQDNNDNVWCEFDLYTSAWGSFPLKRDFAAPIDFREAGEYYIKINAQPAHAVNSQWLAGYDMKISVGDKISFGVKYVEGKTVATTSPNMYPYLTTGETTIENTENGVRTADYHEHFVQIIADGKGNATVTYSAGGKIVLKGSVSGLTTADYICLSGGGSTRLCDIAIERYSAESLAKAREAIKKLANDAISYEDALAEVNKVTGFAHDPLLAELEYNRGYFDISSEGFYSADGLQLLSTNKITDSVVYSFKLDNNYVAAKDAEVILGVYYGEKLAGAKKLSITAEGKTVTQTYTVGFDTELPAGDKNNIEVKAFVWEKNTLRPLTGYVEMYSPSYKAVTPEIFGANTTERVTVAFMGDSITHRDPSYTKWIEYYYRIKYPTKDIKFVSKGISGENAYNVRSRFKWDVLEGYGTGKPDEVCLMIGMNDIEVSQYPDSITDADEQRRITICLTEIKNIVNLCKENDIKLTLVTPTLYDEADYSATKNSIGANAALSKVAEGVRKIANENNLAYIDFNGYINSFNSSLRDKAEFEKSMIFNVADRVHPTPVGTFAEGFIFIDQQINDSVIASVDIDASALTAETQSAVVTEITNINGTLSYTYAPESLPMYMTEEYVTCNDTYKIPVTDSINREIIKVSGLSDGEYKIMFGEVEIGTYSASQLEKGVNVATVETNPGYIQSKEVYDLVAAKMAKDYILRDIAYVERYIQPNADLSDVDACVAYYNENIKGVSKYSGERYNNYPTNKAAQAGVVADIESLEAQAKVKAQPKTYSVRIIKQ